VQDAVKNALIIQRMLVHLVCKSFVVWRNFKLFSEKVLNLKVVSKYKKTLTHTKKRRKEKRRRKNTRKLTNNEKTSI